MAEPGILVVGSANTDMTVISDRLPNVGETISGGQFVTAGGGKGANQAVSAARAGARVSMIGKVGKDLFGDEIIERLQKEGINTDSIRVSEENATGIALIMVDENGENIISVAPGANWTLSPDEIVANRAVFENTDVMLTQLELPIETVACALKEAQEAGLMTILDPAPIPRGGLSMSLLENVDIVTPNLGEARSVCGLDGTAGAEDAASKLLQFGPGAVLITLGSEGVLARTPEKEFALEAAEADPVDTVGAGDCFTGVLAVGLAEGKDLLEAAEMAVCAAAIATETEGAEPSLPSRDEIEQKLKVYKSDHDNQ
ncbi:MAG: ribokinase [Candidatus Brocadiia bacterium]